MWRGYFLGHDLIYLNSCLGGCELIQVFCLTTCKRHVQIRQNEIRTVLTFSLETTCFCFTWTADLRVLIYFG